jgi:hypothetical protein
LNKSKAHPVLGTRNDNKWILSTFWTFIVV